MSKPTAKRYVHLLVEEGVAHDIKQLKFRMDCKQQEITSAILAAAVNDAEFMSRVIQRLERKPQ